MLPTGDPLGTVVTMLATPFGRLTVWLSIPPALWVGGRPARRRTRRRRASLMAFQVPSRFHAGT